LTRFSVKGGTQIDSPPPPQLRANVDVIDEPLTREAGQAPAWSDADIDDVIAFLETLTDRDAEVPTPPNR
jgi:cytochrome c peroxidase